MNQKEFDKNIFNKSHLSGERLPDGIKFKSIWFLLLFGIIIHSQTGWAQVSTLTAWTNFYHGTGNNSASVSVPSGTGTYRLFVVAIASDQTAVGARTITATYGTKTLTLANGDMSSTAIRSHTAIYYLTEADIDLMSGTTLDISFSGGTARANDIWYTFLDYVDQTTPITDSKNFNNNNTASTSLTFASALTVNKFDLGLQVISSLRNANTTMRTITYATNWTMANEQTTAATDGIRNAVASRALPTSSTTDNNSTGVTSGTSLNSITGISVNGIGLDFRSTGTGTYSTLATWEFTPDGSTYSAATVAPGATNNSITILNGHIVTLDAITTTPTLIIEDGATFSTGATNTWTLTVSGNTTVGAGTSGTLTLSNTASKTFSGDVTLNAGSTWNESSIAAISVAGNFDNEATTFTPSSGTHTFSGTSKAIWGSTITSIATVAITGTITNGSTMSVTTGLSGAGTLTNNTNATLNLSGTCSITTLTNNGTLNRSGSGTTTTSLANFTNADTLNITSSGTITGITNNAGGIVNHSGSSTVTSFNNATSTSTLNISTTPTVPTFTTLTVSVAGNTVNYSGAGSQTIKDQNYGGNLTISGSGTKTWTQATTAKTVTGNLTINNGPTLSIGGAFAFNVTGSTTVGGGSSGTLTFTNSTGTKTLSGAVMIDNGATLSESAAAALAFGSDLTIGSGGTLTEFGAATVSVAGNFSNFGTFTPSSGAHTYSGSNKFITGTTSISLTSAVISGNISVNGTFAVSNGITGGGTLTNNSNSTLNLTGGTTSVTNLSNAGTMNISSTAIVNTVLANFINTDTLNISGSGTITGITNNSGGIVNHSGSSTISSFNNATATSILNISTTPTVPTISTLTVITSGNTVNYTGGGSQSIIVAAYSNLGLSGSGAKSGAITTINNNMTMSGSASFTQSANLAITGGLTVGDGTSFSSSTLTLDVTGATALGTSTGGTMNLGSNTINLTSLTINSGTLTSTSGSLLISGDFTNNGTFTHNSGTVSFDGSTQAIGGTTATTFNNLTIGASGTKTMGNSIIVSSLLALDAGVLSIAANTLTLNGTVTTTSGTLSAGACGAASSNLSIGGSGALGSITLTSGARTFNNVTLNRSSGTATITTPINIAGTLTLTNGALVVADRISFHTSNTPIIRTSGTMTMNSSTTLVFGNCDQAGTAFTLPNNLFTSSPTLTQLWIDRTNGITLGNQVITVTGALTVTNNATLTTVGNLTLASTVSGDAYVESMSGTAAISGSVKVERFIPSRGRRWRFMSSAVSGATLADWQGEIFVTGPGGSGNGFDNTSSNYASVYYYNEALAGDLNQGWISPTNTGNTLITGKGYRVFVRGNKSAGELDGSNNTQAAVTINTNGTLNQGTVAMPVSYTVNNGINNDGWNLVGNPYASAIDWNAYHDAGRDNNDSDYTGTDYAHLNPTAYIFDANVNSYVLFNATSTGIGSFTSGLIPSGASFFVKASSISSAPSMNMKETYKSGTQPGSMFKKGADNYFRIRFILDNLNVDEMVLSYEPTAKTSLDKFDGAKMYGPEVNIATIAPDSQFLSVNFKPFNGASDTVPLSVGIRSSGHYRFEFKNADLLLPSESKQIGLVDYFAKRVLDLKQVSAYEFDADINNSATFGNNRFAIIVGQFTGIEDILNTINKTSMHLYPSITHDVVNIHSNQLINGKAKLKIMDVMGNTIQEFSDLNWSNNSLQIDLSNYKAGMYLIQVETLSTEGVVLLRCVKQ